MLVTKDDYTNSERFRTLANALPSDRELIEFAPHRNRSGISAKITMLDMGGANRLDLHGDVAEACEIQASPTDYVILVHERL